MFWHRFLIVIFLFVFSSFYFNNLFAQSCQDCGQRLVGIYDPSISPAIMQNADQYDLTGNMNLFGVGGIIDSTLRSIDKKISCIKLHDFFLWETQPDTLNLKGQDGSIPDWLITPPQGSIKTVDYIIESSVEGTPGNFKLNLSLEAAYSREVIISSSISFTSLNGIPTAVSGLLSNSFIPLYDRIFNWEISKRDNDPDISVSPAEIKVLNGQEEININEELKVDFLYLDCDKTPLKNRKIYLKGGEALGVKFDNSIGGQFTTDYVTTDNEGKASAIFKVGDIPGEVVMSVYNIYKTPTGYSNFSEGFAILYTKQNPADYWHVRISTSTDYFSHRDTSWIDYVLNVPYSGYLKTTTNKSASSDAYGWILNASNEDGVFYYTDDIPIVAATAKGGFMDVSISSNEDYISGLTVSGDKRIDTYTGHADHSSFNLQFYYNENTGDKSFGAGITFSGSGEYHGKAYDNGWKDYSSEISDYGDHISLGWSDGEPNGFLNKLSDGGYVGAFTFDTTYKMKTYTGTLSIIEHKTISIAIHPNSPLTSINKSKLKNPNKFVLLQNYPNPFNPETKICYSVPVYGHVTLKLFNLIGEEIETLVNEIKSPGIYEIVFNKKQLTSGVYFYKLSAGGYSEVKKLVILK